MLINLAQLPVGVSIGGAGAPAPAPAAMPSWIELWNEWEIQTIVAISFSLQVILFFLAGIRRYSISSVLKVLLWLVYLLADVAATYGLGHMSSSLSNKLSGEHQLVAFWAPFLLLHLGGQDTITAYALEDNKLWLRTLLNMLVQFAGTTYVLYKYIKAGEADFAPAAVCVLAAGVIKYGERIRAMKQASKKGSESSYYNGPSSWVLLSSRTFWWTLHGSSDSRSGGFDPPTGNNQFENYAFLVMRAHALCHVFLKPLVIEKNELAIDELHEKIVEGHVEGIAPQLREEDDLEDASPEGKRHIVDLYKAIEVELALMYDILYTKAQVANTFAGHCTRVISLVSCFAALWTFTKSKRDGYSTPDITITFALLGGACALEVTSGLKAIGSTWTCAILKEAWGWNRLANAILFARYHLIVIKDGRWSNSVGQFNFAFFSAHNSKNWLRRSDELNGKILKWIGFLDWWEKARCTKHSKLSPTLKEFVWGILEGDKRHMVRIEDASIRRGDWARKFDGLDQIKQLDWSLSFEFHESMLIWHIATSTFLSNPAVKSQLVDKDRNTAEAVNTLSDYMMYLLVKHPDILPINPDACSFFDKACYCCVFLSFYADDYNKEFLDYKEGTVNLGVEGYAEYISQGEAVLVKAGSIARTMLGMELGLADKMVIIGTVWTEMLCYAATNASGGFHARQLSNGGEFLTHILLLSEYASRIDKKPTPSIEVDETVEASAAPHVQVNVNDDSNDEITEIRPI